MGQKVNPVGIRLGISRQEDSKWYAEKEEYSDNLHKDLEARKFLEKKLKNAGVSRIEIKRPAKNAVITVFSARPGVIIGKKGGDVEYLRKALGKIMSVPVYLNIEEIRKPDLESKLVAENVSQQLERRVMFRKAMKRAVQNTMRTGALGIKIAVSGRLGGAEIARTEWYKEGRVPLHTFRADIDYSIAEAKTTYGIIGVKVWVYRGDKFDAESTETNKKKKTAN